MICYYISVFCLHQTLCIVDKTRVLFSKSNTIHYLFLCYAFCQMLGQVFNLIQVWLMHYKHILLLRKTQGLFKHACVIHKSLCEIYVKHTPYKSHLNYLVHWYAHTWLVYRQSELCFIHINKVVFSISSWIVFCAKS